MFLVLAGWQHDVDIYFFSKLARSSIGGSIQCAVSCRDQCAHKHIHSFLKVGYSRFCACAIGLL